MKSPAAIERQIKGKDTVANGQQIAPIPAAMAGAMAMVSPIGVAPTQGECRNVIRIRRRVVTEADGKTYSRSVLDSRSRQRVHRLQGRLCEAKTPAPAREMAVVADRVQRKRRPHDTLTGARTTDEGQQHA